MPSFLADALDLATFAGSSATAYGKNLLRDVRATLYELRDVGLLTLIIRKVGVVGLDTNPEFRWRVQVAGINRAELLLEWRTTASPTWQKVHGQEVTGTGADVRDGTLGSLREGFRRDGAREPLWRANSYPTMGFEMGPNGGVALPGGAVRSSGVVTVTITDMDGNGLDHGFENGMQVRMPTANDPNFPKGADPTNSIGAIFGVAGNTFQYTQAGPDGANTQVLDFAAVTDVAVRRFGVKAIGFFIDDLRKFSIYRDSMTTEDGIRLSTAGSLETRKFVTVNAASVAGGPYVVPVCFGVNVDATDALADIPIQLPPAASVPGRHLLISLKVPHPSGEGPGMVVQVDPGTDDTINGETEVLGQREHDHLYVVSDGEETYHVVEERMGAAVVD